MLEKNQPGAGAIKNDGSNFFEKGKGDDDLMISSGIAMADQLNWRPKWTIEKYDNDEAFNKGIPSDVLAFEGNLLLNEGITALLNLLIGAAETNFSNANARIGVGNSNTAAVATQTGLQGASKAFKAMDATYPQVSNQTVTFRSTFTGSEGNFAWEEITVVSAADDTGDNLNRKVQSMGTKVSPAVWTVSLEITLS